MTHNEIWVFGYGSLIWKPEQTFESSRKARLYGWSRRFWQGSHDHRGTPDKPGRVVTLVPEPEAFCDGLAFRVNSAHYLSAFESLDFREKNGYVRHNVSLHYDTNRQMSAVVYVATENNFAWLGPSPIEQIAQQILCSHGPSGSNIEYLLNLAKSLREHKLYDSHIFELEQLVLSNNSS